MRKRTNVTIDAALLSESREFGVNLSAVLERGLTETLARRRQERWLAENRDALEDANAFVARHGLWSDGKRQF